MNTEDFVTYEQALALKKLGFDLKTEYYSSKLTGINFSNVPENFNNTFVNGVCSVPTLAQAQKWLRKEKKYSVEAFFERIKDSKEQWSYFISNILNSSQDGQSIGYFYSYEEALSAGITECLKLLENETSKTPEKNSNP